MGLQTDQPFKRAIFPYGGLRMVEAGLKAAGFEADPQVHEAFTKYRKTHNDGVFDAYTPEIMKCRKSGIITGLPDCLRPRPHHRRLSTRRPLRRAAPARGQARGAGADRRHVADRRGDPHARGTRRPDPCPGGSCRNGETLRSRHLRGPPRMRKRRCNGHISPISAPSRKRTARRCRSAAFPDSSTSSSNATCVKERSTRPAHRSCGISSFRNSGSSAFCALPSTTRCSAATHTGRPSASAAWT